MPLQRALLGVAVAVILATGAHIGAPHASAAVGPADDRMMAIATPWWTYAGITADQVNAYLASNGARPTDIHFEAETQTLSVVMVKNAGSYKVNYWWWYYGLSLDDVNARLIANNGRPISISAYSTSLGTRYAVVMVRNTGSSARKWWWYDAPADYISDKIGQNNARLAAIGPSPTGYVVIMVDNSGSNSIAWWWYHGIRAKTIRTYSTSHHARPIDVSRNPGGTFNAVMYASNKGGDSFAGRTPSAMLGLATTRDERILSVDTYILDGVRLEASALVKNSN